MGEGCYCEARAPSLHQQAASPSIQSEPKDVVSGRCKEAPAEMNSGKMVEDRYHLGGSLQLHNNLSFTPKPHHISLLVVWKLQRPFFFIDRQA